MPPRPEAPRRRLVVVQICGLSHDVLQLALAQGRMPRVARLLRQGFRLHRVPASLPTSTPAFQVAVMYGGPVDVPAFEFVDKRTGTYRWFPRPWDAAAVEAAHARGRRGIVTGGRTYGAIFGGGAEDAVLTFARLLRPGPVWGRLGLRARVVPVFVFLWVALRMSVVSVIEVLRWAGLVLRDFSLGHAVPSPVPPLLRVVVSGWLREVFTLGVTLDLYGGVPALYVNFVDTTSTPTPSVPSTRPPSGLSAPSTPASARSPASWPACASATTISTSSPTTAISPPSPSDGSAARLPSWIWW